jgi:SAM-dependent methyltransferase
MRSKFRADSSSKRKEVFDLKIGFITEYLEHKLRSFSQEVPPNFIKEGKTYAYRHCWRYKTVLELIPRKHKRLEVLDVGIGYGHLALLIRELFNYGVRGTDIKRPGMEYWKLVLKRENIPLTFCDMDKEDFPFEDNQFDLIIFCDTIEHLLDPLHALDEVRRVLKKKGFLILTTPNFASLFNRIRLLFGINPQAPPVPAPRGWCKSEVGYGHIYEWCLGDLCNVISELGFKISKTLYVNSTLQTTARGARSRLLKPFYKIPCKAFPPFRDTIVVLAEK